MISAFELMENFIKKRGHSKNLFIKKMNICVKDTINMFKSPKYLENTYRELLRNDKCH